MKEKILAVAIDKFYLLGIRRVSIEDICNDIQISKKTFYLCFKNKRQLVEQVLLDNINRGLRCSEKIFQGKNAIDALISMINELKKRINQRPLVLFTDLERYYPDLFQEIIKKKNELSEKELEKNLQRGIEEGYYRDDLDIELYAHYFSHSFSEVFQNKKKFPTISQKRLIHFFIEIMVRTITNERGWEYVQKNIIKE